MSPEELHGKLLNLQKLLNRRGEISDGLQRDIDDLRREVRRLNADKQRLSTENSRLISQIDRLSKNGRK